MMNATLKSPAGELVPCRAVTADEIAHYQEFGWVKLKKFIAPETIGALLAKAKGLMGDDGDSNPQYGLSIPYFNAQGASNYNDPAFKPMLMGVGKAAKALMNRRADYGIRLFSDFFAPKLPSSKQTKNMGNGPTSFHQDYITFALDRSGGMTFWIPMEAYDADAGTMSFYEKSHQLGVLGNYTNYDGKAINEIYPELDDLKVTEPMEYEVGDVTAHNNLLVHGAGTNLRDTPRWAYLVLAQPADAVWTGAPPEAFDPSATNMKPYGKFDDKAFPIIG